MIYALIVFPICFAACWCIYRLMEDKEQARQRRRFRNYDRKYRQHIKNWRKWHGKTIRPGRVA